ncbi:hypothetical protein Ocin01_07503 [Orchesella cincta]|uniref:Uncharacterized protein n=1 Tax=Orchesella cincta TaxID=48709 RepID=A0A1D2N1K1_ORCCI|nr:hypothetical protein Ocin01_07503 [Orchesella cincta]
MENFAKFCVLVVFVLGAATVRSDDDAEECKKMAKQYFKRIHKVYIDCHADVKQNTSSIEEQFEKLGCTVKCILKNDKMLDDNDMVTDDLLKTTYKDRVTPKYEDKLLTKFMDCKTKFGDKLDKTDEKCVGFKNYGLCMQEALSHVCYE